MSLTQPGEVAAYVQQEDWYKLVGIGLFQEPARFIETKPYVLSDIPDDSWAALMLRVDPLARKILDPRRSFIGAFILFIIITTVFSAIRPTVRLSDLNSYDDEFAADKVDDFYIYDADDNGEDDVLMAEIEFRKIGMESEFRAWIAWYAFVTCFVFISTIVIAFLMERRNKAYDNKIRDACIEIGARFQSAGVKLEYRTHHNLDGLGRFFVQERAIVFHRDTMHINTKKDTEQAIIENMAMNTVYTPPFVGNVNIDNQSVDSELLGVPYLPPTSQDELD